VCLAVLFASGAYAAGCKVTVPLDGGTARAGESTLGDLVADAIRAALRADLALVQAGQLRADTIPVGEFDEECTQKALMYPEEPVVLTEVPGRKIQEALARGLSALPQPNPGLLQVSGLVVVYRSESPPEQRLVSVKVGGEPLSADKTYLVAMPSSLAKGAMGYFRIFDGLKIKPNTPSPTLRAAVIAYARARKTISITVGQRLQDLSKPSR
jgi:2',3'-cyclic-nucleotide 2'-phosphodiesterase (5'-nucleotidase family)